MNGELNSELNPELNRSLEEKSREEKSREDKDVLLVATPHQLLEYFSHEKEKNTGRGYPIQDGKDHRLAKKLLDVYKGNVPELAQLMEVGFKHEDFKIQGFMDTFGGFYSIVSRLERERLVEQNKKVVSDLVKGIVSEAKVRTAQVWEKAPGGGWRRLT